MNQCDALAERQQRPETLEEAVSCTLEMESYALLRKEEPPVTEYLLSGTTI